MAPVSGVPRDGMVGRSAGLVRRFPRSPSWTGAVCCGGDTLSLKLHVELIYDSGCPNLVAAREVLTHALQDAGMPAVWTEWNSDDPACPERARGLGSPTILVNGKDVAPGPHPWVLREPGQGPRCRIYEDESGSTVGVPPLGQIARAIAEAVGPEVG
jgi:hypothetical protein